MEGKTWTGIIVLMIIVAVLVSLITNFYVSNSLAGKVINKLNTATFNDRFSGNCNSYCSSIGKTCFYASFKYSVQAGQYPDNSFSTATCDLTLESLKSSQASAEGSKLIDGRLICGCA